MSVSAPPILASNPLLPFDLAKRRRDTAPGTSLGALADALARELGPLQRADLEAMIPREKARLTRVGGRCPVHGTYLEFDPWQPHRHHCRPCARDYVAPEHDQWWAMGAQLWTAERAVHAAALYAVRGDPAHRELAERILRTLATRYRQYPNQDNVLGPTRPFFSTYLESLWLLNVCQALALLEQVGADTVGPLVRNELIEPSAALIAAFHEGRSNRQVWNGVAVLSASLLLGDVGATTSQLEGPDALPTLMRAGLGPEGGWYEGENYHLFAHRGLWYLVQAMTAQGRALDDDVVARYRKGFAFPFSGLLPDDCFPSRKDSQYRVSIRQWRIAEYLELGYATTRDDLLAGLLARVYDGRVARESDARARSTGDAERNEPPMHLTRASLSWRALLMATPEPPPHRDWTPSSASREHEGLAVMRRERGRVFVGLEGGGDASGHGHPDALALTMQADQARFLEDPGTGSYVDRSLFWYRSTLAHHAPLVNGASQGVEPATVLNFEERGGAGWMRKRALIAPQVMATRACIVLDGYLVDVLEWTAPESVTITLPVAAGVARGAVGGGGSWSAVTRAGAGGEEDGFGFLREAHEASLTGSHAAWAQSLEGRAARAWYAATGTTRLVHAGCPGAPGHPETTRLLVEATGATGRIVGVWSWAAPDDIAAVDTVTLQPSESVVAVVTTRCGTRAEHSAAEHGWHIALLAGGSRSSIDLEGPIEPPPVPIATDSSVPLADPSRVVASGQPLTLGEPQYVATEEPYGGANTPTAQVTMRREARAVVVELRVTTGHPLVSVGGRAEAPPNNPLDNEPVDVNADSLQWYLGDPHEERWSASGLVALLPDGAVRHTPLATRWPVTVQSAGTARADGWDLTLTIASDALPPGALRVNLTINERPAWRERRRGQLRLAGGGFRRYIAGARETAAACPVVLR